MRKVTVPTIEPSALCRIVTSLTLLLDIHLKRFHRDCSPSKFILDCDRLHDFSVTILRCYNDAYANRVFTVRAGL